LHRSLSDHGLDSGQDRRGLPPEWGHPAPGRTPRPSLYRPGGRGSRLFDRPAKRRPGAARRRRSRGTRRSCGAASAAGR